MERSPSRQQAESGKVVAMAVQRAAQRLEVTQGDLAEILGVSKSTVSRMSTTSLKPKPSELALLFIRIYRSLLGIVGDDRTAAQWLHSPNRDLNGTPIELVKHIDGLVRTLSYLDAMRAKI